jgi:undecaprenyl-diphosphatase
MNYQIADAINDLSGHSWVLDDLMTFAARDLVFVAFALFGLRMLPVLRSRDWGRLLTAGATLGLAFGLGLVASQVYAEPRPFTSHHDIHRLISHAAGQSFPSDHATAAFALGFAMLVFVSRTWGQVLLALAVVIGLARIYTGVHYPGDILGSLIIVLLAVGVVELARRLYLQVSLRSAPSG